MMKKTLFLVTILSYIAIGCNDAEKNEKSAPAKDSTAVQVETEQKTTAAKPLIDWSKYTPIPQEKVDAMAAHYIELVHHDPLIAIQQINMDGEMLEALLFGVEGLKLIAAADVNTDHITLLMQFWKLDQFTYYDIDSFFNPAQRGMRGQPALCPPPPGCELPLVKSARKMVITETEAGEMVKIYNAMVKKDPSKAIQQVTMDAGLLELLTIGTRGLKLIFAADLKSKIPTVIMQFWKNDHFYYFNIRDIFTTDMRGMRGQYPLCPPPPGCELPFVPLKPAGV